MTNTYLIIVAICLVISAISKAVMDTIAHHHDKSIFNKIKSPFWKEFFSNNSWRCKYSKKLEKGNAWYYLGFYEPTYKERFPFSTTIFVMFTDAWHLFQFLILTSFQAIILLPFLENGVVDYILSILFFKAIFGFIFELFYTQIFKTKH